MIKYLKQEWKTENDKDIFKIKLLTMELLKFITAGNIDDGKSTLIGRLLYDSKSISNDILENIQLQNGKINFAHLTDGLKAEREQGITIDVAYKYFTTDKRKFIIADCPGHKEYTRNMITGASHSDIAIILIDAQQGITEQTKRHTFIVDMMNIPCIIFCINKMDKVHYDEKIYQQIAHQLNQLIFINNHQIEFIPISALFGDNVVHRSQNIQWYEGPTLLYLLENFPLTRPVADIPAFLQVQYVTFQNEKRYFFGTLINGSIEEGEEIIIYPTKQKNKIKEIFIFGNKTPKATGPQAIALTLQDETEIQRGYYLVTEKTMFEDASDKTLNSTKHFSAICFWLDESDFIPHKRYIIQHHAFHTYLKCQQIQEILDLDNLKFKIYDNSKVTMNSIFKAKFIAAHDLLLEDYKHCPELGSFIIIDETSHKTVGAGIVYEQVMNGEWLVMSL